MSLLLIISIVLLPFVLTWLLTPIVRIFGKKFGVIDIPGRLSIHKKPVPRVGGIAIYSGFLIGSLYFLISSHIFLDGKVEKYIIVLCCALVMGVVGFLGDIELIPSKLELALQFFPSLILIFLGVYIKAIPFSFVSFPISLFYLVGSSSAMNLLDGMDGLASGIAAISLIFLSLSSYVVNNYLVLFISLSFLGSTMGFLYYNFPPANIFLGDVGSLLLGFVLAITGILLATPENNWNGLIGPILILGLPVLDTGFAICRRLLSGRDIVSGDREHLYDLIHERGYSAKSTIILMYIVAIALGFIGFLVTIFPVL